MKTLLCCAAFAAAMTAQAKAEMRYDRTIEKAAMAIVAAKMGSLRGSFSYADTPQFVTVDSKPVTVPTPVEVSTAEPPSVAFDGLMPAVERRVSRIIF